MTNVREKMKETIAVQIDVKIRDRTSVRIRETKIVVRIDARRKDSRRDRTKEMIRETIVEEKMKETRNLHSSNHLTLVEEP